jgi:hypothetical protein
MTETFLAVLSPDNVLRIMSKNGTGIEERAALALGYDLSPEQLFELTEMLVLMTNPPEPEPVKPKAKKATPRRVDHDKAKKAESKSKVKRGKPHAWLKSSTLIRFINEKPGMGASDIAKHVCIALGREYSTTTKGDGLIVKSRVSNLVNSGYIRRTDGSHYATVEGINYSDRVDPIDPAPVLPVPEGQELLAE